MAMSNIVAGTHTFKPFSLPTSLGDPAIWREEVSAVAPMYRPTIKLTSSKNKTNTNINMSVKVNVPDVVTVNGSQLAPNKAIATATITSLQNVTSDVVAQAIDGLITGLTATRTAILAGTTVL